MFGVVVVGGVRVSTDVVPRPERERRKEIVTAGTLRQEYKGVVTKVIVILYVFSGNMYNTYKAKKSSTITERS